MRILQINTFDIGGGAAKISWNLFNAYHSLGHLSKLAVGYKRSNDPNVVPLPHPARSVLIVKLLWILYNRSNLLVKYNPWFRHARYRIRTLASGGLAEIERERGFEDFNFPGSHQLLKLLPKKPDLIHAHNLHGEYFDLRYLPKLNRKFPIVLTLHDAWLISGHCAHSFDCVRWQVGCGQCPDLTIYPSIRKDASRFNWQRKSKIYRHCHFYLTTPSKWLMDKVRQSMIFPAILEARVIPNGVDLSIYKPADYQKARYQLNLPVDANILLFTGDQIKNNIWKDYITLREALERIALMRFSHKIIFVALGEDSPPEQIGNVDLQFIPYQQDDQKVAMYYQAANIYIHSTKVDTFPNTILEALACGTPVVATEVGGIPEQIADGDTGFLIPVKDSSLMADRIVKLLKNEDLYYRMKSQAAMHARRQFDLNRQVKDHIEWYEKILKCSNSCSKGQ
jgi:glycosyltransferase involved in cell wall biosynthesis